MSVIAGFIGAGFMGKTHAAAFAKLPGARIAYVMDINKERAEKLARELGGLATDRVEDLLEDPSVNLVDVTTPTPSHPENVIRALEAGKHVIVEKPLALSVEETDHMLAAARRSGRFLMVAHVLRFWPEYMAIQSILKGGRIGAPQQATAYRLSNGPQWAPWFRDPNMSGGALLDLQIHDIDLCNWLFGMPKYVKASGVQDKYGAWSHVMTLISYQKTQVLIEASYSMPRDFPFTAGIRVMGEKGLVEYHFRAAGASFEQGQPVSYLLVHTDGMPNQKLKPKAGDGYENEIAYFVECIEKDSPPEIVTAEDARLAVQVAMACRQSIETGENVRVETA